MQYDTKKILLDNAERLFAERGVQATSIRDLARAAGVNIAAVNYHFGSKEGLVEQVIERRLLPLNQARKERLLQVRMAADAQGRRPRVDDLLGALIEPTFEFAATLPESRYFLDLISRAMAGPDPQVRAIFFRQFKPLFHLVYDAMRTALPELQPPVLLWRLYFAIGALHSAMRMVGRKEPVLGYMLDTDNTPATVEMLLTFISSGMQAPCLEGENP